MAAGEVEVEIQIGSPDIDDHDGPEVLLMENLSKAGYLTVLYIIPFSIYDYWDALIKGFLPVLPIKNHINLVHSSKNGLSR